jgi:GNAT superfamily N-acetyltransferase
MVLGDRAMATVPDGISVRMLDADGDDFEPARAAVDAGFNERDALTAEGVASAIAAKARRGPMRVAGAFDSDGRAIGGGSHATRGDVTEPTGIAVLPAWRRRGIGAALAGVLACDARAHGTSTVLLSAVSESVARVYPRVGFVRVRTACIAEYEA